MGVPIVIPYPVAGGGGIESGVSWDEVDVDGHPTAITVYGANLYPYAFSGQNNSPYYWVTSIDFSEAPNNIPTCLCQYRKNLVSFRAISGWTSMAARSFQGCTGLTKFWIPSSCTSISFGGVLSNAPFNGCSSGLTLYCEPESKPAGWATYWEYRGTSSQLTVVWDVSLEDYLALP